MIITTGNMLIALVIARKIIILIAVTWIWKSLKECKKMKQSDNNSYEKMIIVKTGDYNNGRKFDRSEKIK